MPARLRRRNALVAFARAFQPGTPGIGRRVSALPRLVKATLKGEYDGRARLVLMTLAGIYIFSPLELIPYVVFVVFGVIDDAFVISWLIGAILSETERFLAWERDRGRGPLVLHATPATGAQAGRAQPHAH
jgi:uncharacterized membrane protein YkvA (DUF1232 family)